MIRRFFSYYRPYKGLFLLDFCCAVIAGLLELGFPLAVNHSSTSCCRARTGADPAGLSALLAVYAEYGTQVYRHLLGPYARHQHRDRDAAEDFDHLQKLSFRFYDNQKTGHLVARVTKDLEEIGEVAHHGPEDVFIAVMTFIGAFALMFMVNASWR